MQQKQAPVSVSPSGVAVDPLPFQVAVPVAVIETDAPSLIITPVFCHEDDVQSTVKSVVHVGGGGGGEQFASHSSIVS